LAKLIPAFFDYREKAAVLLLYEEADLLERAVKEDKQSADQMRVTLDDIEQRLAKLGLGASRHVDVYNLRGHLDLLRTRLDRA
jgi:hypothetical protein